MSPLIVMLLGLLLLYAIYIATGVVRTAPADFAFGGARRMLPGWAVTFSGGGILIAAIGLPDFLSLTGRYGLQFSHTALGLVIAALASVLIQKRLWLAGHIADLGSPGEALGRYYQSVTLRIVAMVLAALFALPFAATALSQLVSILEAASGAPLGRGPLVWILAFFLFLAAVIGGWRGTILVIAGQSVLLAVLMGFTAAFGELAVPGASYLSGGIPVGPDILADRIPGVIQYSASIGKGLPKGGLFTAMAIASTALSLIGIVLSPGYLYLGMTARSGRAFAFGPVWLVSGLAAGLLLFVAPFLAARLSSGTAGLTAMFGAFGSVDVLAAVCLIILLATASIVAITFFANAGALLITRELIFPYVLPSLGVGGQRLAARIALAVTYIVMAGLAAFAPLPSAILGSIAVPLAAQLLPALLGLAFVPWISRSAVLTGMIVGGLLVFFTEPPGLILFEGLFLDLPWGRWPLTIHAAAWGLAFNFAAVLLVSIFTRRGAEREHRDRLHTEFAARWKTDFGGPTARSAKWSLILIWAFLAVGPGAVLGNSFFSEPIFSAGKAALGIPSLWVWQMLFWLIGVMLVWWIAYPCRLGITTTEGLRRVDLTGPADGLTRKSAPAWIAQGLARLTER